MYTTKHKKYAEVFVTFCRLPQMLSLLYWAQTPLLKLFEIIEGGYLCPTTLGRLFL